MMKKYFFIGILILISQAGYSQNNVNQLFKEFSKQGKVTSVNIGNTTMKLASLFTDTFGVDDIEILEFSECGSEVKERLDAAIKELKDSAFETMVSSNEKGNHTKVMIRIQNDIIRELVVLSTGSNPALIRIKGSIKPSDLEKVVKEHGNGC